MKMPATNPKFRAKTGRSTTRPVSRVWMFSHECAGLAQVGGLGEAVSGLSKTLAMDSKLNVSVFLPSHGRHLDPRMRETYGLQDLTTFMAQGHRTGTNGVWYKYMAGVGGGSRGVVKILLPKKLHVSTPMRLEHPTNL